MNHSFEPFGKPFKAEIKSKGRIRYACEVFGEQGSKYMVKLLEDCRSPGRNRQGAKGDTLFIPKKSIKISKP